MIRKLSLRLLSALAVLGVSSGVAEATTVYSDTVLAHGPEYASAIELTLAPGTYRVTTTDLRWLNTSLSALSFGIFDATAPIKTMAGAGTLEFFHAGDSRVYLQIYARPGVGRSGALIGLNVQSTAVVALPASAWLLLSALTAAGFWGWLQRRALALSEVVARAAIGGAATGTPMPVSLAA